MDHTLDTMLTVGRMHHK